MDVVRSGCAELVPKNEMRCCAHQSPRKTSMANPSALKLAEVLAKIWLSPTTQYRLHAHGGMVRTFPDGCRLPMRTAPGSWCISWTSSSSRSRVDEQPQSQAWRSARTPYRRSGSPSTAMRDGIRRGPRRWLASGMRTALARGDAAEPQVLRNRIPFPSRLRQLSAGGSL